MTAQPSHASIDAGTTTPERRSDGQVTALAFWIITAAIGVTVAVSLAVIGVTLNRGFDWSDEGFIYVMVSSNREALGEFWGFQHLLHPLYQLFGDSILAFRIIRLIGYMALAVALTAVAKAALDAIGFRLRRSSWILVLLVAQAGTLAAWSYPPRYLGYNELSAWLTQLGGAALILLLIYGRATVNGPTRRRTQWLLWAFVGFVLGSLFVAKITASIGFGVFALVVALLPANSGRRWTRLGFLAAGVVTAGLAMLAVGAPVLSYARSVLGLLVSPSAQAASGYSVKDLIMVYIASATVTLGALAAPVLLTAVVLTVSRGLSRAAAGRVQDPRATSIEHVTLVLCALVLLIVMSFPVFPPGGIHLWEGLGVSIAFTYFAAVLGFAVVSTRTALAGGQPAKATTVTLLVILFTLIPLVGGLGTNNPLMGTTVFSATMWAVGVGVALLALWERSRASWWLIRLLPLTVLAAIVAAAGFAVAGDVFAHPYRTQLYLSQKTESTVDDFRGLRLSEGEADLVSWLDATGEELSADDSPAVSIASPGALLAFNASGWANPWPGPDWATSINRACEADEPEGLFILQSATQTAGTPGYDQLKAGLAGCDIDFPRDFERVAHHDSANQEQDVTVWQLR